MLYYLLFQVGDPDIRGMRKKFRKSTLGIWQTGTPNENPMHPKILKRRYSIYLKALNPKTIGLFVYYASML